MDRKKIIYVLLLSGLLLEMLVVFFHWPWKLGFFLMVAVLVALFPRQAQETFFPASVGLAVFSTLALIFSHEEWASRLVFLLYVSLVLLVWSLVAEWRKFSG